MTARWPGAGASGVADSSRPQSSHGVEDEDAIRREEIFQMDCSPLDLRVHRQQVLPVNTRQQSAFHWRRDPSFLFRNHHIVEGAFGDLPSGVEEQRIIAARRLCLSQSLVVRGTLRCLVPQKHVGRIHLRRADEKKCRISPGLQWTARNREVARSRQQQANAMASSLFKTCSQLMQPLTNALFVEAEIEVIR